MTEFDFRQSLDRALRLFIHEINDKCGTIASVVQFLKKAESVENFEKGAAIIETDIADMTAFASRVRRIITEELPDNYFGETDVLDILREVKDRTDSPDFQEIEIVLNCGKIPELRLMGNRDDLLLCFHELVKNSIESMNDGGIVEIRVTTDDDSAIIDVIDNGSGMSPELRSQVFMPFYSTKGHRELGIGLNIAENIVMRHGGSMSLESKEGVGTRISVRIPLRRGITARRTGPKR